MFVRAFLVVCVLSSMALGQSHVAKNDYARIELKDFAMRPADHQGRRVLVTADVVSISADFHSLNVFDTGSKSLVLVSIAQLSQSQRRMLINGPVTRVTVWGKIEMRKGRAMIKADRVSAVVPETLATR
ncbi:MAG: hypothetical protein ACREEM_34250 [Blastocatellia bacterium]